MEGEKNSEVKTLSSMELARPDLCLRESELSWSWDALPLCEETASKSGPSLRNSSKNKLAL